MTALIGILIFLLICVCASADNSSKTDESGLYVKTMPSVAFPLGEIGLFTTTVHAGYPYVNHPYTLLSDEELIKLHNFPNQTLRLIAYSNPPLFPNETVYGILHEGLGYVSWLKEIKNPDTGVVSLCQVADTGEFGENPYMMNLSPAENDYLGYIQWFVVDGKLWPRTWINGTMYEGQTWSEWWGPFIPDNEGSIFRQRDFMVTKGDVPIGDQMGEGYILTSTGPGEFIPELNTIERVYSVDGIGPIGHDFYYETKDRLNLDQKSDRNTSMPSSLPPATPVFSHEAKCSNLTLAGTYETS